MGECLAIKSDVDCSKALRRPADVEITHTELATTLGLRRETERFATIVTYASIRRRIRE